MYQFSPITERIGRLRDKVRDRVIIADPVQLITEFLSHHADDHESAAERECGDCHHGQEEFHKTHVFLFHLIHLFARLIMVLSIAYNNIYVNIFYITDW